MALVVRELNAADLADTRRIMNLAFGTFIGVPDPANFFGDMDYAGTRFDAPHTAAYVAEEDGRIWGTNFATRWGSVAFFGPLSVDPEAWDRGIGKKLLAPVLDTFSQWRATLRGLYTFPQSAKHVGLYHSHGFHPRFLTAVMSGVAQVSRPSNWVRFTQLSESEKATALRALAQLCDSVYPGLDLSDEIKHGAANEHGDTVILGDPAKPDGFAVCHCGPNTEAGSNRCYVKFAAVRPGDADAFRRLLCACSAYAAEEGVKYYVAGVNTARDEAYRIMRGLGMRTQMQGVIMHAPNIPGYSDSGHFVIDDWR
ncbi:MAG: GNAT family N-acetyltransferase [Candidatus Hydrogenedentales bacterium]